MTNTIQVSSNIWNWVSAFVRLDDSNRANLELWKSGEKQPTFNQLEEFSRKTRIPFGYFFLNTPPVENMKLLEFRTVDSLSLNNPSRDLIDTVRQMENIQEWMREYIATSQGEKISFVGMLDAKNDILSLASLVRKALSLPEDWFIESRNIDDSFRRIRLAISDIGVIVMLSGIVGSNTHRSLNIDEFRAFTLVDDYASLIFLNATDSQSGKLFSLIHEFMHIGFGSNSLFNVDISNNTNYINPNEVICNAITAEILAPASIFKAKWYDTTGELSKKIFDISKYFKCSKTVIARRALDNMFIKNNDYNMLVAQIRTTFNKKSKSSGGDYYKTQASRIDRRFLSALNASVSEGKTLHTEAFRLTNTNRTTFENLVNEVRGERK